MSLLSLAADQFRRSPLYRMLRASRHRSEYRKWDRAGRTSPPPHLVKQKLIRRYAARFQCSTLVETGTYRGDMMLAMLNDFRTLYSIELHPKLHARARRLFQNEPRVHLLQGDSGERIADVLKDLNEPTVFWLDGHYSAGETAKADLETPIIAELDQVLRHKVREHIILIDDARLFVGKNDYPTIDFVKARLEKYGQFQVEVEDDVIAIVRKAA